MVGDHARHLQARLGPHVPVREENVSRERKRKEKEKGLGWGLWRVPHAKRFFICVMGLQG
jgi:hypothetical protein